MKSTCSLIFYINFPHSFSKSLYISLSLLHTPRVFLCLSTIHIINLRTWSLSLWSCNYVIQYRNKIGKLKNGKEQNSQTLLNGDSCACFLLCFRRSVYWITHVPLRPEANGATCFCKCPFRIYTNMKICANVTYVMHRWLVIIDQHNNLSGI